MEEHLEKIYIDLPNDGVVGGESVWAKPLGGDLFEVRNSPWHAYDVHFGDVVRAIPRNADEKPWFREVVKPSGHKTLRVLFPKETPEVEQAGLLDQLSSDGASYERANSRLVAVDVLPGGNYQRVCDRLWAWEQEGLLDYETGTSAPGAGA
jgi:Domain of unknown function (DUF4265)